MLKYGTILFLIVVTSEFYSIYGQPVSHSVVDTMIKENSYHLMQLVGVSRIPGSERMTQYFSNPFAANENQKKDALNILVDFACLLSDTTHKRESYIIQDEIVFKLCVCILANNRTYLSEHAFEKLVAAGRYDHLAKYSDVIKQALTNKTNIGGEPVEELLCLLNLSIEEKNKLLETKRLPDWVRARLGDTTAENNIINKYLNENSFRDKEYLANELGMVTTHKCINVLVKTFNDSNYDNDFGGKTSITGFIIPAFGRLYPDNLLLTDQFLQMRFSRVPKDVKAYLYKVMDWMKQTYGVSPDKSEPLPFIMITTKVK